MKNIQFQFDLGNFEYQYYRRSHSHAHKFNFDTFAKEASNSRISCNSNERWAITRKTDQNGNGTRKFTVNIYGIPMYVCMYR